MVVTSTAAAANAPSTFPPPPSAGLLALAPVLAALAALVRLRLAKTHLGTDL